MKSFASGQSGVPCPQAREHTTGRTAYPQTQREVRRMPRQSKKRRWSVLILAGALAAYAGSGEVRSADPADDQRAALEEKYGLEPPRPAPERGALWDLTHGDWGVSLKLPQLRADAGK